MASKDRSKQGEAPATVAVVSIGEMGLGVAKLLAHHKYKVLTNIEGRRHVSMPNHYVAGELITCCSEHTQARAKTASIELVTSDEELVARSDYFLSIVPPKDALATAQRIASVFSAPTFPKRTTALKYLDLNAVSPKHIRDIAAVLAPFAEQIHFIDGCIIGGAPIPRDPVSGIDPTAKWNVPSMPMSGPHKLSDTTPAGDDLATLLNSKHINDDIGTASGLKMCFAAMTKGFQALAVASFTTAHRLGVVSELQEQLKLNSPATGQMTTKLTKMPPKAYRWVKEMQEIGDTFAVDGGWGEEERIFNAIAAVYRVVAKETELGNEVTEKRKRGTTVGDIAACVAEGLDKRRKTNHDL